MVSCLLKEVVSSAVIYFTSYLEG